MHTTAANGLHEYLAWRRGLVPLEIGTVIQYHAEYGLTTRDNEIRVGQCFKILEVDQWIVPRDGTNASKVYTMQQCTKKGKLYKRKLFWNVEGIARWIDEGKITIV